MECRRELREVCGKLRLSSMETCSWATRLLWTMTTLRSRLPVRLFPQPRKGAERHRRKLLPQRNLSRTPRRRRTRSLSPLRRRERGEPKPQLAVRHAGTSLLQGGRGRSRGDHELGRNRVREEKRALHRRNRRRRRRRRIRRRMLGVEGDGACPALGLNLVLGRRVEGGGGAGVGGGMIARRKRRKERVG